MEGDPHPETRKLQALIGEWTMEVALGGGEPQSGGMLSFEWMPGERYLVQRWQTPVPEAPDGLAIIGVHSGGEGLLQHYFDSRGVARVYEMSLDDGVWELRREKPDFSPLEFKQRYRGTFSEDGGRIDGSWEIDHGSGWEKDFDLSYVRRA